MNNLHFTKTEIIYDSTKCVCVCVCVIKISPFYVCFITNVFIHFLQNGHNCHMELWKIYDSNWHDGQSVRQWSERHGFNARASHTKDSKNGT